VVITLRRLGFREWWRWDDVQKKYVLDTGEQIQLPSVFDSIRDDPQPYETELIAYLESAPFIFAFMHLEGDLINPDRDSSGAGLQTDGIWNWDHSMSYYVREYHAQLPIEFVEHTKAMNWIIPDLSIEELTQLHDQFFPNDKESLS
jgi:hypothetical protein